MSTNDIPTDWGNWTWNATSIGTIATLGGVLVIGILCLCISNRRRKRRAQALASAVSSTETLVDDEEAQMKTVYERASIPVPLPAYLSPTYRCSGDHISMNTSGGGSNYYQTPRRG